METKLVKPVGFIKSEGLVKSDVPHKADVQGKSSVPVRPESPQKAAIDGRSGRPASPTVPLLNAAASLGLPKDALSAALLVFTRFFSLSADKALLGSLRREILDLQKTSSPGTAEEKAALEARVMAAVIAADKGVYLSPAALERYARFLMPPAILSPNMASPKMTLPFVPRASGEKESPTSKAAISSQDSEGESLEEVPEPEELRAIAETQTREDGFLDLFNGLPGKNGQYWLVFPFDVKIKGIELKVLLRVMRNDSASIPGRSSAEGDGQLIADISGPKRQWRFFVKKTAGKFRADIQVCPEYSRMALNHMRKQAERFLVKGGGSPLARMALPRMALPKVPLVKDSENFNGFEEIIVRNSDRIPLWTEDLRPGYLPFVNEEV